MSKPTLYAVLGDRARLQVANGDSINEIRALRVLSSVFDVYYNNARFDPAAEIGPEGVGTDDLGPDRPYDFHYIRNNPALFAAIDGPKLCFAYPYDEAVFAEAAALVVPTGNWKDHLLRRGTDSEAKLRDVYEGVAPEFGCPVLTLGQTIDPALSPDPDAIPDAGRGRRAFAMRAKLTGARAFGLYGNLNKSLYPYRGFAALERLARERGGADPVIALAGRFRAQSRISYANSVYLGQIPHRDMGALYASTWAVMTNESPLNHCLGNQKTLEAMQLGLPVFCQRLDTFEMQLGADYPGLYADEEEAYAIAARLLDDPDFAEDLRARSRARAPFFTVEAAARAFRAQPELAGLLAG